MSRGCEQRNLRLIRLATRERSTAVQHFVYDTIDSTNDEAKRLLAAGEIADRAWVLSREQTAGRGSRGRTWNSPANAGLYVSLVDPAPRGDVPPTTLFTLAAGVSVAGVLRERTKIDARIKPVNDVYIDGAKLAGILTEAVVQSASVHAVVIGIGLNLGSVDREIEAGTYRPVALEDVLTPEAFSALDADALVAEIVVRTFAWNELVWAGKQAEIERAWRERLIPEASGFELPR